MKRKDLQHLKLDSTFFSSQANSSVCKIIDGITVQQCYTKEDIAPLESIDFAAGFAPFVRGITPALYLTQPCKKQQLINNTTPEKANAIAHRLIAQKTKIIAFNLRSIDYSISTDTVTSANRKGILINTVEDVKMLLDQLPLADIEVALTTSTFNLALLAFYIVALQEEGIDTSKVSGNFHFDGLYSYVTPTSINARVQDNKAVVDSTAFIQEFLPKFKTISISNLALKQIGVSADIEVAYSLAQGLAYIKAGVTNNNSIDFLASQAFFSWVVGSNHFMEIAKMRAARLLWTKLLHPFKLKNESLAALSIYARTQDLDQQENPDHITRTTLEATAAVFGGIQSLSTIETTSDEKGLDLQYFIEQETNSCKTVDPWGGSYYVEKLTLDIADKAWEHLQKIDQLGGMSRALESGILESIATSIDPVQHPITRIDAVDFETSTPQKTIQRDETQVQYTLDQLATCVTSGEGNLLVLAIAAARARATHNEIQLLLTS